MQLRVVQLSRQPADKGGSPSQPPKEPTVLLRSALAALEYEIGCSLMTWQPGLFTESQIRVAANVLAIARKYFPYDHVPDLAHLGVTKQESNWDDSAAGDNQQSFGPYQIYVQAHPEITPGVSTDPWYDYGFPTMHERWASSWLTYSLQWPNASEDTRGWILEQFAPAAQGSIAWTPGMGIQRYHEACAMLERLS